MLPGQIKIHCLKHALQITPTNRTTETTDYYASKQLTQCFKITEGIIIVLQKVFVTYIEKPRSLNCLHRQEILEKNIANNGAYLNINKSRKGHSVLDGNTYFT